MQDLMSWYREQVHLGCQDPKGAAWFTPGEGVCPPQPCHLSKPLCPKWDIGSSHLPCPLPHLLPSGGGDDAAYVWKQQIP